MILFLDGWITLDEEKSDILIANKNFQEKAKDYHFSRDFQLISDIQIAIDITTGYINSINFNLDINGEDGKLNERKKYEEFLKKNGEN